MHKMILMHYMFSWSYLYIFFGQNLEINWGLNKNGSNFFSSVSFDVNEKLFSCIFVRVNHHITDMFP